MKKVMISVLSLLSVLIMGGAASALTVTASGFQPPNKPSNVIDNSINRWSCQGECWLQLDLGFVWDSAQEVWIAFRNGDKRTAVFDITVSADGVTWHTVFSGVSHGNQTIGWEEYKFSEIHPTRYIRFIGHGNSFNDWNSISEMYPWDPWNDSWGQREVEAVSASRFEKTNTPQMVLDNNLATHWTADTPAWIQFDLGYIVEVGKLNIAWKSGNKRVANFDIQISEDGTTWETAFVGNSSGGTLALESFLLEFDYCARYVRVVGKGNSDPKQAIKNSITEVEVWGRDHDDGDPCEVLNAELTDVGGRI